MVIILKGVMHDTLIGAIGEMNKTSKMSIDVVSDEKGIKLNNARTVLKALSMENIEPEESVLTMVQGNEYNHVEISDTNIKNNSQFIVSLWD